jgi:hypothetical protein
MIEKRSRFVYVVLAVLWSAVAVLGMVLPRPAVPPVTESDVAQLQAQIDGLGVEAAQLWQELEALQIGDGAGAEFGLSGGSTNFDSIVLSEDLTAVNGTFSGAVSTGALTPASLSVTGAASVGGSLTLESVAFSGPTTFGSATSVVSGTTIAHGLATTPTTVLLTPVSTGGYTTTVPYVMSADTTSITVGVADGVSISTLYWLAGK